MMRSKLLLAVLVAALVLPAGAQALRVVTEDWAPFNYPEGGKPMGLGVEMVQALLKEAGLNAPVEFLPWNRAYDMAQKDPNVLIFTMGRNADRESMFTWLFRIAPREIWLMKLAERSDIKAANLEEAKKYKVGAGPTDDASAQELIKAGFELGKNLDAAQVSDSDTTNLQKLFGKRVDMIASSPFSLAFSAKRAGFDFGKVSPVVMLSGGGPGYWAALSKSSSPDIAKKLQDAAARLDKSGAFKAIQERYLK